MVPARLRFWHSQSLGTLACDLQSTEDWKQTDVGPRSGPLISEDAPEQLHEKLITV